MNEVDIAIRALADVSDATDGLDDVGKAARDMSGEVERAARDASSSLDGVGDAVDSTATNASVLAGAFGDVAGGLGLIGLGGFSDELEAAAPALMLAAGAADIASVAMNTLSVSKIKDTAMTVANTAATVASTAAKGAATAATWALNAALSANPIGLIILAVVALVAILVVLYNKFPPVREAIQAVGRIGRQAIGWVVEKVTELVGWVRDKLPAAWETAKSLAVGFFRAITTPQRLLLEGVQKIASFLTGKLASAWDSLKGTGKAAIDALLNPLRTAKDLFDSVVGLVQDLIAWIGKIDLGPLDDIAGAISGVLGRAVVPGEVVGRTATTAGAPVNEYLTVNIYDAYDPDTTARKLESMLNRRRRSQGQGPL